jgi:hypothetical protein
MHWPRRNRNRPAPANLAISGYGAQLKLMSDPIVPDHPIILPVDRARAAMRGLWRLALMLITAAPTFIMTVNLDWKLLRLSDPASFYGLGVLWLGLAATALGLFVSAARWLLLSVWHQPLLIRISPREIAWNLGPFGQRVIPVQSLEVRLFPEVEPELLESIPDDALTITMRHRSTGENIGAKLEMFVRINAAQVWRLLQRQ